MTFIGFLLILFIKLSTCFIVQQRQFPSLWRCRHIKNEITQHHERLLRTSCQTSRRKILWAQKKTSSDTTSTRINTNRSGGGGGFEKQTKNLSKNKFEQKTKSDDDDTSIFPPLDDNVLKTIIPSIPNLYNEAGELPYEIYDRLNQIYGFPHFNYESSHPTTTSTLSLSDLLTNPVQYESTESNGNKQKSLGSSHTYDCLQQIPPFTQFRVLHIDPLVLAIDDFFTNEECDRYISISEEVEDDTTKILTNNNSNQNVLKNRSPTVGKDLNAKSQRTSTTYYHLFGSVCELMSKATRLLGLRSMNQWEEPQTVRYRANEKFTWHLDALDPNGLTAINPTKPKYSPNSSAVHTSNAGQRLATLLVYLTDVKSENGGATIFRDLQGAEVTATASTTNGNNDGIQEDIALEKRPSIGKNYLRVQPKKGMALLFFPAAGNIANTPYDIRTIHCGEMVTSSSTASTTPGNVNLDEKWIAQIWLRASQYQPTAPPGNQHDNAIQSIEKYCDEFVR